MSGDSAEDDRFVIVADARRRWSREQKQAIVAECADDRASVSAVARKHNIATSLLFRWRREVGVTKAPAAAKPKFIAVSLPAPVTPSLAEGGLIEIELAAHLAAAGGGLSCRPRLQRLAEREAVAWCRCCGCPCR